MMLPDDQNHINHTVTVLANQTTTTPENISPIPTYVQQLRDKHAFQIESLISIFACLVFVLAHSAWTFLYLLFVGFASPIPGFSSGIQPEILKRHKSYLTYDLIVAGCELFMFGWFVAACVKTFKTKPIPSKSKFFIVNIFMHFVHLVLYFFACVDLALIIGEFKTNGLYNSWVQAACALGFLGTLWWVMSFVLSILQYDFWSRNGVVMTSGMIHELNQAANVQPAQHDDYISIHEEEEPRETRNELTFVDMNSSTTSDRNLNDEHVDHYEDRPKMSA
ncbi:hypothetical protein C9374_010351 [Naegleria lovaniensis]|uniref:Uncharacterized protein n=1 Tax=Naegleria lovaniensis TaxID=51637 RepID=A0AA88KJJ9_NAELO|nr:uncharacterized protein C9374_010351 [Naegleria lovaniensis]KAG2374977.1 hypothetical protein C9374_010351 [Naegleria lovaniensis]